MLGEHYWDSDEGYWKTMMTLSFISMYECVFMSVGQQSQQDTKEEQPEELN